MLSYRHAFHAGNHADILKHIALRECLSLLRRKEKGFLAVDTHAGAGAYDLDSGYAAQNEEWAGGIARLKAFSGEPRPKAVAEFLEFVEAYAGSEYGRYPGSPSIISGMLRPQDRAVFCELHPTDHAALETLFSGDRSVGVRKADGFAALKAALPPPTRRGLIFMDPSYELSEDYDTVVAALNEGLRRFAGGVFVLWYPLLDRSEARELPLRLADLPTKSSLSAELLISEDKPGERGMFGSGLFIVNPPWTLSATLGECLPYLARALGAYAADAWKLSEKESAPGL